MIRPRAGWLVASCAAVIAMSGWLPWLTTKANGGGHASAIAGTAGNLVLMPRSAGQLIVLLASVLIVAGAMTARGLSPRPASSATLVISLMILALTVWYHHLYVRPPIAAAYGFYVGAAAAIGAVMFSAWAVVSVWTAGPATARATQ